MLPMFCVGSLLLCLVAGAATAETPPPPTASPSADVDCTGVRGGHPLIYRNTRFGLSLTYPSTFTLDPDSIPESGDSARFWTSDRRGTAVIMGMANGRNQSLADLLREARQDVVENSRGTVTYERSREGWFVISGFVAGRIYYRRTFLANGVVGTLWIEFPRSMRACFDKAVTMMSLSFRHGGS